MLKRILVPLDRSEIAEQALPVAAALASRVHAAVTLAAVIVPAESWSGGPDPVFWQQAEEAAADRYLSGIEEGLRKQGIPTHKKIAWGPAAATISRLAEGEGADLIVMTTHGRSGVVRWVMGSVADKLLHIAPRPILLLRAKQDATFEPPVRLERILVPLDGSALSESVLPLVEDLACRLGATLVLGRVVQPATIYSGEYIPPTLAIDEAVASATKYLDRLAEKERLLGVGVDVEVAIGQAAEAILDVADQNGVDLIALSSHGWSGPMRWIMGSVADAIVRHSTLPCLVLPAKASAAQAADREGCGSAQATQPAEVARQAHAGVD